ncbi:uncharacterized protein LY89DRAFT_670653 [Mollisia scopiformis]|uniref:Uncharacterized protein n=1 Tax=Mollisia scopiformis TaxID=149040 RepID=A0A194X4N8_MOLSC|nr:uncharacterized protein LY89DRAFT_670653 [Mollisia scopiformis]KUJ15148.1 hypothetical protein LY89DRAFT_670653 [Mollisia scopiformis]
MADQITTVSSLPPGYGTLAGTVYAIIASPPADWNNIAWAKMGRVPRFSTLFRPSQHQSTSEASGDHEIVFRLRDALSRSITKRMRKFRAFELDIILKRDIAVLYVISLWASSFESNQERQKGGIDAVYQQINSIDLESIQRSRTSETSQNSNSIIPVDSCPLPSTGSGKIWTLDVRLQVVQYTADRTPVQAMIHTLSMQDFEDAMASALQGWTFNSNVWSTSMNRIINTIKDNNSTTVVLVQAAAPFDILVVEIAFKAVEVLLACAVILGSTAGAWLGLTLGSIFPRRAAAGLFVSSYGQTLGGKMGNFEGNLPYPWPPAGTVWSETEGHDSYCVLPQVKLSDKWRNAIGYWIQFCLLMVYRHFKLPVRNALGFGPYVFTRDAVRYIVLALEPFIIVTSGNILHQRLRKFQGGYSLRNILAIGVYVIMLSASLTIIVLGQKSFLNPMQSHWIGELVDLFAAAGSVALINIELENEKSLLAEKWILIWAIGACTIYRINDKVKLG